MYICCQLNIPLDFLLSVFSWKWTFLFSDIFFSAENIKPVFDESVHKWHFVCVQQLLAEPLWTVDTQKNQQTITNVVSKRALGVYVIIMNCTELSCSRTAGQNKE